MVALLALLACSLPRFGTIAGRPVVLPPVVNDPVYGRSEGLFTVLRVDLAPADAGPLGNVGALAHAACFPGSPPLSVTVNFATRRAGYADPASPWFNSFFGAYELTVGPEWGRPFGYTSDGAVHGDDLARILEADWNWLSNWVYGVPASRAAPECGLDPGHSVIRVATERVGDSEWDVVEIRGVRVVSGYVSGADGGRLLDNAPAWSATWRAAFGYPRPRADHPTSFPAVTMHARLYLATVRDGDRWRTRVFGGAVREAPETEALLDAQLAASRRQIERRFPDAGRAPSGGG